MMVPRAAVVVLVAAVVLASIPANVQAVHYANNGRKCNIRGCDGRKCIGWVGIIPRVMTCYNANCAVGSWGSWGRCSRPCGGGTRSRSRAVTRAQHNAGSGCPSLSQTQNCNSQSCNSLTLPSYGDSVPSSVSSSGVGAKLVRWSSVWYSLTMSFYFKCEPGHRQYGTDPRKFNKLTRRWTSSGLECTYCKPGRKNTGARACSNCPKGTDNPYHTRTSCRDCVAGRYADNTGTVNCKKCAAGRFQSAKKAQSCDDCPPGKYASGVGNTKCSRCAPGKYAPNWRQSQCYDCPVGRFAEFWEQSECQECTTCSNGCQTCNAKSGLCPLNPGYCAVLYDHDDGRGAVKTCFKELETFPGNELAGVATISQVCLACQSSVNTDVLTARRNTFRARIEIAGGKPTSSSSLLWGNTADAVDGNDRVLWTITDAQATASRDAQYRNPSNPFESTCFSTGSNFPNVEWFKVDLGAEYPVELVQVYTPAQSHIGGADGLSPFVTLHVRRHGAGSPFGRVSHPLLPRVVMCVDAGVQVGHRRQHDVPLCAALLLAYRTAGPNQRHLRPLPL